MKTWTYTRKSKSIHCDNIECRSTKIKCPFCDAVSLSIVEYRPSFIGYLLTILAMLIFGILSLVLMPVLVSLTKSAIHRCAKCLNEVKTYSYFGFSSMEDKLVTLQLGKFGVILTRRLLLYTALIVTAMLAIYTFVWIEASHNHEIGKLSYKSNKVSTTNWYYMGRVQDWSWTHSMDE